MADIDLTGIDPFIHGRLKNLLLSPRLDIELKGRDPVWFPNPVTVPPDLLANAVRQAVADAARAWPIDLDQMPPPPFTWRLSATKREKDLFLSLCVHAQIGRWPVDLYRMLDATDQAEERT
ncbi:MAG: hypothetical protein HQL42_13245 [Alphaproteobacteria bacterium]|nr:hypothetical protein [Alphaproteobacteria bacterium]